MDDYPKYFIYNGIKFPYFNKQVNDTGIKISLGLLFLNTFGYGAIEIGNMLESNNHACADTIDLQKAYSFNYLDRNVISIDTISESPDAINLINEIKKSAKNYLFVWSIEKNLTLNSFCNKTFDNVGIITNLETLL
jgi:flagellar biosynthesis GTPase FlhF